MIFDFNFEKLEDGTHKLSIFSDTFKGLFSKDSYINSLTDQFEELQKFISQGGTLDNARKTLGELDNTVVNFAKNNDIAKISSDDFKASLNKQTLSTKAATVATKALNAAMSVGIMLAVSVAISAIVKGLDALIVTTEEQQQKVDELKSSYETLNSEFETLSSRQDLTESEKERLNYLERRLELDKQILDAETRLLYQKQNGQGSLWDNLVANFDKDSNKAQLSSEFGYKKENFGDYLTDATLTGVIPGFYNVKAALDGYDATINKSEKLISQFKTFQEMQQSFMESGDDTWVGIYGKELEETEEKLNGLLDDLSVKYKEYEQEYLYYQEQIDSGVLYGDDLKHAKDQKKLWKESSEGIYEQITAIQKLLGTYDYWKELEGLEYFNKDEIVKLIGTEENLDVVTQKLEKDYPKLNQWMNENGVSVQSLINHYKELVSVKEELAEPEQVELLGVSKTVDQLNTQLKPAMDSLATTWKDIFSGDNGEMNLDDIDLLSISDTIKSELDKLSDPEGLNLDIDYSAFEEFVKVLEDTESTEDDVRDAFDKLAQSIVDASVSGIEDFETLKDSLEDLGVVNNEIIAFQALAKNMDALKASGLDLENATLDDIETFVHARVEVENYAQAINILTQQKILNSIVGLDTSQEVSNLRNLAATAGVTGDAITTLTQLEKIYQEIESGTLDFREQNRRLARAVELKRRIKEEIADLDFSPDIEYDGSSIAGGLDSASSSAKETAETFDWIETLISRIQRNITNLGKVVSATYRNWSTRNNALAQEMAEVNKEISVQQNAYNAYMAKAESIGLSNEYKALVQSGGYRIDDIADETLKEQISSYKEWYEKALSCSDAIEDLRANLAELAMTKFDNVAKQYDEQISLVEHNVAMLEGFVSQSEAAGYLASEVYYEAMAEKQEENIAQLQDKYSSLLSAFDEAVKNGSIEKYSEDWYTMLGNIDDVEKSLQDATTELIEFNQTLQQLNWEVFDRIQGYVNNITAESEHLVDILDTYNLHTSKGIITEEGLAVQGLHAVNYNVYMEQALAYAEEMAKIEEEMAKDPYDMELVDRRNELIGLQQEAIQNAMSEKEAILDLIADGYDKMLNSLQEVIDKRKEALQAEKDLYDYQSTIEEKTSNISSLQKQLQAYTDDNSEEAKATIQKLQVSLAEAEKDLQETEYEKYLSDQEQMLDSLYDQTEQWVNTRLDNIDGLVAEAVDATNKNAETISNTLHEVSNAYGYKLSEQMESIWNSNNEVVSVYGDILYGVGNDLLISSTNITNAISGGTTSVIDTLNTLNVSMRDTIAAINKMATDNANGIAALQNAIIAGQSSTSIPTTPTTNTPSGGGGSSNSSGTGGGGNKTTDEKYVLLKENGEIIDGGLTWQQAQGMSNAMSGEQKVVKQNSTGETVYDVYDNKTGKQMASGVSLTQAQGMCNAVGSFYYKKRVKTYATGTTNAKRGVGIFGEEGAEILVANDGSVLLANGAQLYPFQGGETVFNAEDTSEILKNSSVPLSIDNVGKNIAPNMNGIVKNTGNNVNQDINVNFELPNVIDANSLIRELQSNKRFEQVIQNMTADRMLGKNSLSKYSI